MVSQSSSVGYTIMGKTADLTVVQKTTIDTLHKEDKTQKVIAKEAGFSPSSVSKHINREAKGRKRCGRKKCNYMTSTCICGSCIFLLQMTCRTLYVMILN